MILALVLTALFVAATAYGMQLNERRQSGPKPPLSGSADVPDRDLQRIRDELTAARTREPSLSDDDAADVQPSNRHAHRTTIAAQH